MKRTMLVVLAATTVIAVQALPSGAASRGVKVGDDFFSPTKLTVAKGTKVTWRWVGHGLHNVTKTSGPQRIAASRDKTSGSFGPKTLSRAGTYRFTCTIHGFKMKIIVQ